MEGEERQESRQQTYPKTHAMSVYCLAAKELEELPFKSKPNPYRRSGPAMKLYKVEDLEQAALQKWGSLEALEAEREKRAERRQKRAAEGQAKSQGTDDEEPVGSQASQLPPAIDSAVSAADGGLHPLIRERILPVASKATGASNGRCVLYWMRTAVRDHDNPSLDVARTEAARRGLPLLAASFLFGRGRHTHPTHRRFQFLLEGLREAQASLAAKGVPLLVFVEGITRQADGGSADGWQALLAAARQADLVVTDLMPTPPYAQNLQDLAKDLAGAADLWAVDSACLVPVTTSKAAFNKAYAFRNSTAAMRKERLARLPYSGAPLEALSNEGAAEAAAALRWSSLDLATVGDLAALLKQSDAFDAAVPGVSHMPGGQSAGYARWEAFKRSGLAQYAARRNNPMLRDGVSRMSAYHHFGMVSPFRVAREASAAGSPGARKFADEFLTWRELSYNFCHHNWRRLESLQVLPTWAQKTLAVHAGDARDVKSLAALEAGETGDEIWDALQHQLNTTGELHNNVRMTWGKAPLRWTPDPEAALRTVAHLNHRFALDGCDPSSYGGILWCFGQFDGPKGEASTPIFGTLRNRPTAWLTKRLSAAKFRELPLEPGGAAGGAAAGSSAGQGSDIRQLFGSSTAQQPTTPVRGAEAAAPAELATPAPAGAGTTKRGEATQASIEQFFKRSKA